MIATGAEKWFTPEEIYGVRIGNQWNVFSHGLKEDHARGSKLFSITNRFLAMLKSEQYAAYDDDYIAGSEQEKADLIERLTAEINNLDARSNHNLSLASVR
jgi:hypothetical protein